MPDFALPVAQVMLQNFAQFMGKSTVPPLFSFFL
jgi:hypothetical protein